MDVDENEDEREERRIGRGREGVVNEDGEEEGEEVDGEDLFGDGLIECVVRTRCIPFH